MTTFERTTSLLAAVVAGAALALGAAQPAGAADEPLKVGFVYVSPIGDAGWTYQHELGRLAVEDAFGDKVQTKYVENVPEGAEAERVIRDLAASGHELIFTTSFGYMNPTIKVAKMFPEVLFEHATGYKRAKNVSTYIARFYEGRYLAGIVAGKMTSTNVAGYVAAFPIPEVIRGINAFARGMRSVNPEAEVKVIWVNSWFDPGREREASDVLLAQGADVITHHTDSTAPTLAAEEKGKYVIAYHSDMSKYGADAHLTASTHNWSGYYVERTRAALAGRWESQATWGGLAAGMVELAPFNSRVPEDVARLVEEKRAAIVDGRLHPFDGPVLDQAGATRVPAGETMGDDGLLNMDYYVDGVQGKLPK